MPSAIAIDTAGNAWLGNVSQNVTKLSPSGASLFGSGGETVYSLSPQAGGVAIDALGNAWFSNKVSQGSIVELSNSGALLSPAYVSGFNLGGYRGGGLSSPQGIAIDGLGNAWTTNTTANTVTKVSSAGSFAADPVGFSGGGLFEPVAIAIDGSGNAWVANGAGSSYITKLSNNGIFLSGSSGLTGGGLNQPQAVAIDGAGNAWFANTFDITEISGNLSFLSGPTGYTSQNFYLPKGMAVDGSGNVWMTNSYNFSVLAFIGAATPVITPIAAGTGNRP